MSNNSIQESLQYWRQFDLPGLQKELDEKANDLANRQDESESSRKKLVEFCKDFKKTTPEDIKKVVTPVLKAFQSEVDNLSKRSKAAEAAFLTVYKKIIDANDPATSLDYCLNLQKKCQKTQDLEIENTNLRETLQQYNKELADVKNQEITIRQLKEKIRNFEDQMESLVKQKITEKEQLLVKEYEEKQKRLQDEKYLLEKKCKESEQKVQSIEQTLDAVQQELFTLKSRSDDLGHAHSSEMEILVSDLEKANLRAASAEKECEMLREKLDNGTNGHSEDAEFSNSKESDSYFRSNDEAKDRQISQLLDEINQVKTQYEHELTEKSSQVDTLQDKLNDKISQIDALHSRVNSHKDYDEIKQELNVLKSVYLGNNDDDQAKNSNSTVHHSAPKSLDILLLEKNKGLQLDRTALLARKRELENELAVLREENRSLNLQNDQNKQLINNLEQDLMRVHNVQLLEAEVPADQSTLDLISDAVGYNKQTIAKQSLSPTNAQSLLPVVANQRERLRIRVEELEEINMQNQQQTAVLNGQIERLQADNVKLYEKIKFLQSYQGQTKANKTTTDDVMSKYSRDYEASLDPFQRFGVQERQKRYMALSTRDKATLSISRIIINNPTARAVFFFYLLLLHCLVFLVLYRLAYTESCQRSFDTECMENYRQHMQAAHGDHSDLAKKIGYSPAG